MHTNTYVYDLRGNVTATTNALGGVTKMAYDVNNNKTTNTVFLNGQPYATSSYIYDTNLNVVLASTDPLGNSSTFTYNQYGQVKTSVSPCGCSAATNYYDDATGNLIAASDAMGNTTSNFYSGGSLLVGSRNAIGTLTTNYYDNFGNLTGSAVLLAGTILSSNTFAYDANGNRTNSTVWRRVGVTWVPAVTTYIYDAMNRVVQSIDPDGGTNTVVYNLAGKQQAIIDKLGRATTYDYDNQGRLWRTTYPDLTTEISAYDANGNRTNSVDRASRTTTYVYDALNRLTNTVYADNTTNTTIYDGVGRVAQTIDARGIITAFAYDVAGQQIAITNAFGTSVQTVSSYGYDANGNQVYFTNALGRVTTSVYDVLNRRTEVWYPDGTKTSTGYDAVGRRMAETNQDSIVTRFGYDGAGRLVSVTNAFGTSQPLFALYDYDEAGNLMHQIDALYRTNTFSFDNQGRRVTHTMPGNQAERFAYDLGGNLIYQTNFNGIVITNQYDVMSRLTNRASVNGYKVNYTYTLTGQRQTMTDVSGITSYSYDNRDRLQLKSMAWTNGPVVALNYRYDANDNLTNLWSSTSGGVTNVYQYDALNRLTNVAGQASSLSQYAYDAVGNLQTMRYGNNFTNLCQYDALNRLTNSVWNNYSGLTQARFAYRLMSGGTRTNLVEMVHGVNRTYAWSYDNLYRLTNEVISAIGSVGYAYDPVGNRTNRQSTIGNLPSAISAYGSNDWLSGDVYDANGNTRTNSSNQPYFYDVENRLTNFNNGAVLLAYNGDGVRVKKTVGGTTTYYLVDDRNPSGYAQVLEEYQSLNSQPSTLNQIYNYGLSLISQNQGSTVYYFVTDGHGSTRMLTDGGGNFINAFAYDAFGTLIASNGVPQTAYLYCGQQRDFDLNLDYNRARYLNPNTGRFWTADSYAGNQEQPLSLNLYTYAQDNPVLNVDPSGHEAIESLMMSISISSSLASMPNLVNVTAGKPTGKAKCDVTTALNRTLDDVELSYRNWDFQTKIKSCLRLVSPLKGQHAWDIRELHMGVKPQGCQRAVTFKGSCHYSSAVNYALYGKAMRLCGYNPKVVILGVEAHKYEAKGGLFVEEAQSAVPFALYGYSGIWLGGAPRSLSSCQADNSPAKNYAFHWHWLDGKPFVLYPNAKINCP